MDFIKQQGWDHDIIAHARRGGYVTGLCGGYQIMGKRIIDECGIDGAAGKREGLGLLNVETHMQAEKSVHPVAGHCAVTGEPLKGYEIHTGRTAGPDTKRPMALLPEGPDGARSQNGHLEGTYIHGLFGSDDYRAAWLSRIKSGIASGLDYEASVETALDELADALEKVLDIDAIFSQAKPAGWQAS